MGIFSKKIDEITKDDLKLLLTEKERESIHIDYKKGINPSTDGKHDLIKHVVGMANTEGGYIIYGIEENKENGIPIKLIGIEPSVGSQKVDEWIENVINPHVSPRIFIKIKSIQLSPKRVGLVLWIPQSTRQPHMSTFEGDFRIYRRYNTQTLPASEAEIREMYLRSNKTEKNLEDFMNQKNLTNTNSDQFSITANSKALLSKIEGIDPNEFPIILLSSCPRFIEEKVDIGSNSIRDILGQNFHTKIEHHDITVFHPHDSLIGSNSITYTVSNVDQSNLREYLEIQRNGFVEEGISRRLIRNDQRQKSVLHLGRTTITIWSFINFVKSFYEKIGYFDDFSIFLSIRNINQLTLSGFFGISKDGNPISTAIDDLDDTKHMTGLFMAMTYEVVFSSTPREKNFSYGTNMTISDLDEKKIFDVTKTFSTRIANAFGLPYPYCYNHDGTFAQTHLQRYNNFFG